MPIKYILFDAANTLIYKPDLWIKMDEVLNKFGVKIKKEHLQYHHKLISECVDFPDQTSRSFYQDFNKELLISLGIVPEEQLVEELFAACSYLPWKAFEDTICLKNLEIPLGVLSNFNSSLNSHLGKLFGDIFSHVFVSEDLRIRKPHEDFFRHAIDKIGLPANEVLYVGDSFKLDIVPGLNIGFNTLLIDRIGIYEASKYKISNLSEINNYL